MNVDLREQVPDSDEYFELLQTTGWDLPRQVSREELDRANRNSWLTVCAYDDTKLVGFGRVITDLVLRATIFDMVVLPEYQRQGIGSRILEMLVTRCQEQGIRRIELLSARGKRHFYEKHGFVARPEDGPGMQLRIEQASPG